MEIVVRGEEKTLTVDMKAKMSDILMCVSWRHIARTYFGKSSSWLYHKMDGIDGNGGIGGFTEEEAKQLRLMGEMF